MMNYVFIFICAIVVVAGIVFWLVYKLRPVEFSETVNEFYDDHHIKKVFSVIHNRKNRTIVKEGLETVFYPTGEINKQVYWKNGKKHGSMLIFYKDGSKYIEASYSDDVLQGKYLVFDIDGSVLKEIMY